MGDSVKKGSKPEKHNLHSNAKLVIVCGDDRKGPSFGRGAATLMRGVERHGSLSKAAKELHMAYSKAWTMMARIEKSFGITLLIRDGARGSKLTEEGKRFLELYEQFEQDVSKHARESFEERFGDF